MGSVEKRSGDGLSHGRVLALAVGVTATVIAWGVLVFAAIDFGRSARDGQSGDWRFLLLATVGAVACMFLAIVLSSKMQTLMRGDPTRPHSQLPEQPAQQLGQQLGPQLGQQSSLPRPKSAPTGGKRAAR